MDKGLLELEGDELYKRLRPKINHYKTLLAQPFTPHTNPGFAPWTRKRKTQHPTNHPSQVTQNIQTNTTTIPPWSPPQPTPPPPHTQSPTPMEQTQSTTHQPTPPSASSTARAIHPNQPANNPNHAIPPLMSNTLTPTPYA